MKHTNMIQLRYESSPNALSVYIYFLQHILTKNNTYISLNIKNKIKLIEDYAYKVSIKLVKIDIQESNFQNLFDILAFSDISANYSCHIQ